MQDLVMTISVLFALFLGLIAWSHASQQPIILMLADNKYRDSDCVYLPVPGVRCELDY
jgi:hypothetical protein